ncbi:condensation domain-containing protein, partial [Streptomyces sp. NPDC059970]|uniref:condensation domain-containing protein n=1 Tax=Streptomyces sp. NPDC059970 TaxID=3347019 RepID=UPI003675EB44
MSQPRETSPQFPLSFAQQRLWFLASADNAVLYNLPIAWRLKGMTDVVSLRSALADVVARHESLRTVFPATEGRPRQEVIEESAAHVTWTVAECSAAELPQAMDLAARHSFDLECELPIRVSLFVVGPQESVLMLVL